MTTRNVRTVNVVPIAKIKKKINEEEYDDVVSCKVCSKSFASHTAFQNHAQLEHIDEYALNGISLAEEIKPKIIQIKKKKLVSSKTPTNPTALKSKDFGYIIIEGDHEPKANLETVKMIKSSTRKEKAAAPISGPFECTQPLDTSSNKICHQIFLSCCEYSVHYRDEHTRRRKGFRCQVCEKPLVGVEVDSPFPCQVCGAGFETRQELSEHNQTAHVKIKPFQCSVCLKRFTQQGGLQQHMRMHTGDRPFVCPYCPKAFTQKSGLEQHVRIHTKLKPYRCVICSKSFCQSIHLQQHMRTHTNVAPFECGVCQKRFKQSSHLNYHLRNHNPLNMTDDQKVKYAELMQMIKPEMLEIQVEPFMEETDVPEPDSKELYVTVDDTNTIWVEEAT